MGRAELGQGLHQTLQGKENSVFFINDSNSFKAVFRQSTRVFFFLIYLKTEKHLRTFRFYFNILIKVKILSFSWPDN